MESIDCAIMYEWGYDKDFVSILSERLDRRNIRNRVYLPDNLPALLESLRQDSVSIESFIDRASDVDNNCEQIVRLMKKKGKFVLNDPDEILRASDKATMHLEFITGGIYVPYTIIISPYNAEHEVSLSLGELAKLGRPFIIKPANTTGGGVGVVTGAEGLQEVVETRQHNKDDKYLLQEKVKPLTLNGKRAWFRSYYVFGKVFTCWWDDLTHLYSTVLDEDRVSLGMREFDPIVQKIHGICGLDFFSTEIAVTPEMKILVIDYVNEMCDMRLKSKHFDGVPDEVVDEIADSISMGIGKMIGTTRQCTN